MATDIKKLNEEYLKQDSALKKLEQPGGLKDKIADFEDKLNETYANFKIKTAQLELANSRNDKATAKALQADIEQCQKAVTDYKSKLEKAQAILSKQKKLVDSKFEELSKDPETKKKLDAILYKRYDRNRKQEIKKKQQLETIQQILDNHPNLQKLLKGINNYTRSIKGCNTIIKNLSSKTSLTDEELKRLSKAKADLPNFEAKRNEIRGQFIDYFSKNHPEIDKILLENINSYENLNRQINRCEKSIVNYDKAMKKLPVAKEFETYNKPISTEPPVPMKTPLRTEPSSWLYLPSEIPSWRHPIKRIKYIINNIKSNKQNSKQDLKENLKENSHDADNTKHFKDSLKLSKDEYNSEIVQKYLEKNYQENLHNVARKKSDDTEQQHDI